MIFLSAQPDDIFFIWQLEVQLNNFKEFNINRLNVHVLVAYDEMEGINRSFDQFARENSHLASFYYYPDKRTNKKYISSIRPHIIKQHYIKYPQMEYETVFYHDADILFTYSLPDFERLCRGDAWYFSNTGSYMDLRYLDSKGPNIVGDMCKILRIDRSALVENDNNVGGAQCLVKGADAAFWETVEIDSTNLYVHLQGNFQRYKKEYFEWEGSDSDKPYVPVASWCADMWAILWNALKTRKVIVDKELDFCWAIDDSVHWGRNKIFHNAGIDYTSRRRYFYKSDYKEKYPYDDNFDFVSQSTCSYHYVMKIKEISFRKQRHQPKTSVIIITEGGKMEEDRILLALNYLDRYLDVQIILSEFGEKPVFDGRTLKENVIYQHFKGMGLSMFEKVRLAVQGHGLENLCFYNLDIIVPPKQMHSTIQFIENNGADLAYTNGYHIEGINGRVLEDFTSRLDVSILNKYQNDSPRVRTNIPSFLTINKTVFEALKMGTSGIKMMDFFIKEIIKKCQILNLTFHRDNLNDNSGVMEALKYKDQKAFLVDYRNYLKVCNISKSELLQA